MKNKYLGMTINERLFVSGLTNEFDEAVKEKNIKSIRNILKKVDLEEASINPILEHFGLLNLDNSDFSTI